MNPKSEHDHRGSEILTAIALLVLFFLILLPWPCQTVFASPLDDLPQSAQTPQFGLLGQILFLLSLLALACWALHATRRDPPVNSLLDQDSQPSTKEDRHEDNLP